MRKGVTGCHSILVDSFKDDEQLENTMKVNGGVYITDGKYRVPVAVDENATVYNVPGTYTVYHVALEHDDNFMNYGIYANGLLVETCSKRYLSTLSEMTLI